MFQELDSPPDNSDSFFWTDFVEINAIGSADKCFSRGDLVGVAQRGKDRGVKFDPQIKWREILDFSQNRAACFGQSYPFEISADNDTIHYTNSGSDEHTCYSNLLIASGMRHLTPTQRVAVARFFEEVCFFAFAELMPAGSEIRATWAGGGSTAVYTGTLFEKLKLLASDIRCAANFSAEDFKEKDRGDGGIDLIAWHPMYDNREGLPIAFAQCGCSKEDWKFKQLEASPSKHWRNLPVMHPWSTFYFMPLDLRRDDGDWAYKSDIGIAIIVDRLRLLKISMDKRLFKSFPVLAF